MVSARYIDPDFIFLSNKTPSAEIYTLSLHDALPIFYIKEPFDSDVFNGERQVAELPLSTLMSDAVESGSSDRKSTRLNSSHPSISYAVFCLKKKTHRTTPYHTPSRPRARTLTPYPSI